MLWIEECNALWGNAFTKHVVIGKIFFVKKYLITPSVFKLQNQKSKSDMNQLWPLACDPWTLIVTNPAGYSKIL